MRFSTFPIFSALTAAMSLRLGPGPGACCPMMGSPDGCAVEKNSVALRIFQHAGFVRFGFHLEGSDLKKLN